MTAIGKHNLITDVPGLLVGNARDHDLKSGTTVLTAGQPFTAGVHVMGGAPGTRETDLLAPDKMVRDIDALVLSGGSAFGLDACTGVVDGLRADGRGFPVGPVRVPIVPGAIIFDLMNGGNKDWDENPYPVLGRRAYADRGDRFELGSTGAGFGALAGDVKGGLGSASVDLGGGLLVGALVAVNALGNVLSEDGGHFWAAPFEVGAEFGGLGPAPVTTGDPGVFTRKMRAHGTRAGGNSTIGIVATNADLDKAGCQRIATAAHDGFARALVPAHMPADGDLIFGVSTRSVPVDPGAPTLMQVGHAAAVAMARAIARAIYHATPAPDDTMPCFVDLAKDARKD